MTPVQGAPPLAGAGSSHTRTRDLFPMPHEVVQVPQGPQRDHFPSTGLEVGGIVTGLVPVGWLREVDESVDTVKNETPVGVGET